MVNIQSDFSKVKITSKKFIGRKEELGEISKLLKESVDGKGNLVLIEGEAGIGKTRLIYELVERKGNEYNIHFLRGRCQFHQGLDPYSPFIEALRNWFGITESDTDHEEEDKIGHIIRAASPELIGIVPLIRGFLSAGTSIYGSYLFKGSNIEKSFETFKELVAQNKTGLLITREPPDIIRDQYDLGNTDIYWLTRSSADIPTLDPSKIEKLRWIIKDFVSKNKNSVVLIDGLEYLILQNNFNNVLKFVELLKDEIALNDSLLLLPINPATLESREIALLERYMRVISSDTREYTLSQTPESIDVRMPKNIEKSYPLRAIDMDYLAEKNKMFKAILQLFDNITSQKPLLLFLDDLHWADYSSIQLLEYLIQNMISNKILIVGCYRPEDIPEGENLIQNMMNDLKKQNLQDRLYEQELGRLKRAETNKLVRNIFDDYVPEKFLNLIYKNSEGNPLYAEEIIKSLIEDELIDTVDKNWYETLDYNQIEIPNSINEVVQMRLNRVTKGNELIDQVLRYSSIIGSRFNFDVLLESLKFDEELLLDQIERLMNANIIHEISDDQYKFDHTLIREVINSQLSARRKKIMHAKIGNSIEELHKNNLKDYYVKLAYHFSKGGVIDKAVHYSIMEGEVAKELCAYDEAIFHYRSALEILEDNPEMTIPQDQLINLHINLGDLSIILGAWSDAKNYLEKSLEICKEFGYDQMKVESTSKLDEIEEKKQKWSLAIHKIQEVMNLKLDEKQTNILLVTIDPKYVIRANISLITILLKENLKGIYICINHPSYLVDKILRTHEIPTQNLSYLDFISPLAGIAGSISSVPETVENVLGIDKAFSMGSLLDAMNIEPEEFFKQTYFDLKNVDFIMVDNISNLITYAPSEKLRQFVENFSQIIKKLTSVYGIVIMDNTTDPEVQKVIEPYFDKSVSIKEEWL